MKTDKKVMAGAGVASAGVISFDATVWVVDHLFDVFLAYKDSLISLLTSSL